MTARLRSIAIAAAGLVLALAQPVAAQDFPIKPITLIVPFPAGGPTDLALRALADAADHRRE
jgi:tripartite-type tricarboxylate transporter receptor subunit TctC